MTEGSRAVGVVFEGGVCGMDMGADDADFRGVGVFEVVDGN